MRGCAGWSAGLAKREPRQATNKGGTLRVSSVPDPASSRSTSGGHFLAAPCVRTIQITQRGGTTATYSYICLHHTIVPPPKKEGGNCLFTRACEQLASEQPTNEPITSANQPIPSHEPTNHISQQTNQSINQPITANQPTTSTNQPITAAYQTKH